MAITSTVNLLADDTGERYDVHRWTVGNASIKKSTGIARQETKLGSGVGGPGLRAISLAAGDVVVRSPLFKIDPTKQYQGFGYVITGAALAGKTVEAKFEYFDVEFGAGTPLSYVGEEESNGSWVASTATHEVSIVADSSGTAEVPAYSSLPLVTFPYGFRRGTPSYGAKRFWVPASANYARLVFTVKGATAVDQGFYITDASVVNVSSLLGNKTLSNAYRLLPEFIRMSDQDDTVVGRLGHLNVARKLLASSFGYGITVGEEIESWKYERSTDSKTGVETKSALTDPLTIKKDRLSWLSQMLGVDLTNPYSGMSMWISLPSWDTDTDSTTWQAIDILDAESASDEVTWAKARSSSYEDIDGYRNQILHAYNGLNASKPESMENYLGTVMDTTTPDSYFLKIKKNYRESPFLVKYVFDKEIDPDPGGTLVGTEMESTLSMGTTGSQSSNARDAGEFAYEAKEVLEANVPGAGVEANDDTVLILGSNACTAIPDATGSGRHINLFDQTLSNPKHSRYGIIAGSRYLEGFAFYPSGVTGSKVHLQAATVSTGLSGGETDADYVFHVSDISYGNSKDIILFEQGTSGNSNYRACVIDETGVLKYLTGASGSAASTAYSSATHTDEYDFTKSGSRWIRISVTSSQTKFYVAGTFHDVCHSTTYLINTVSLSSPNVYDNSLTTNFFIVDHEDNGIVGYRAIVADGTLDSSLSGFSNTASSVLDLNLSGTTSYTPAPAFYDGVDTFTLSSVKNTDVAYSLQYEANPLPLANWIGLPHTGTDYLYFGKQSSSGDSVVVSGMASDTYNWTVTYTDGTTATGSASSVTTITWAAATYGGKQITKIEAIGQGGSPATHTFIPSVITAHTATASTGTDSASGTWTINRAWEAADGYEHSSIVDRDLFQLNREGASSSPHLAIGRDTGVSLSVHYRRFKTDSGNDDFVFKHPNFQMKFSSSGVTFIVTDAFDSSTTALNTAQVVWDDTSRIGQWNHVGLVRDPVTEKIYLYANGTAEGNTADTTLKGLASRTGSADTANVLFHTDNEPGWQFNHFAIFKEALSAADMERVRQTLPT